MLKKMKAESRNQTDVDYKADKDDIMKKRLGFLLKQADIYSHFIRSKDNIIQATNVDVDGKTSRRKANTRKKHDELDNMEEVIVTTRLT